MDRLADILEQSNQAGMGFLLTELDAALTFLSVADTTRNPETAVRNRNNARVAYESVLHYRGRLLFGDDEKAPFEEKLAAVKRALMAAGIAV